MPCFPSFWLKAPLFSAWRSVCSRRRKCVSEKDQPIVKLRANRLAGQGARRPDGGRGCVSSAGAPATVLTAPIRWPGPGALCGSADGTDMKRVSAPGGTAVEPRSAVLLIPSNLSCRSTLTLCVKFWTSGVCLQPGSLSAHGERSPERRANDGSWRR